MIKHLFLKRCLGNLCGASITCRDVILIYHSVAGGRFSISEEKFCAQMGWLKENAQVVTLDELLNNPNQGNLRVVLSFDDGYQTLFNTVHPILESKKFPAIVYLVSHVLGGNEHIMSKTELGHYPDEYFLNWSEVSYLIQHGWTVGGHGMDHIDLTKVSLEEATKQLSGCKEHIESRLGVSCHHFAYTWGHYNSGVSVAVTKAGYHSAVSGIHGPIIKTSNRFALPRVDIRADYELRDFIDAVTGRWDYLGWKHRMEHLVS